MNGKRPNDVCPYVDVILFGEKISGLRDSGASITCIGDELAKTYLESGKPLKRIKSSIQTGDELIPKRIKVVTRGQKLKENNKEDKYKIAGNSTNRNSILQSKFDKLYIWNCTSISDVKDLKNLT
uniref:Uncharacterized protein n=1 Tax=Glossina pallidipes TaxID=7398 RepID=A0A1A9ZFS4_GLOPL